MSKRERREFYKAMDTKYDIVQGANELHSCAGQIIVGLGLEQSQQLLAKADDLDEWLALCKANLAEAGRSTANIDSAYKRFSKIGALYSAICRKYALPADSRKRRTEVAKFINQLGVERCSRHLRDQKSYPDWLEHCKAFRRRIGGVPRKKTKFTVLPPPKQKRNSKTEVVVDRKLEWARNWHRKNAKHKHVDDDGKLDLSKI